MFKKYQHLFAAIAISIILFVLLSSCGITNKVKSSTHTKTDSASSIKKDTSATIAKDSTHVIKDNIVTIKVTDGEFTKTTIIEFDTTTASEAVYPIGHIIVNGSVAADYFPHQPIKKITIKETGKQSIKEQTNNAKIDSTKTTATTSIQAHTEQDTHVTKETTTKSKEVHRTNWNRLWWLLIPAIYIVYKNWDKIKLLA